MSGRTRRSTGGRTLEQLARLITEWSGHSSAFAVALGVVVVWALLGPVFDYSDSWQLVINTGTTVVTFLMVFLIQRAQNKESLAVQLKLNELVAALSGASNRLVNVEDLSEEELEILHEHYRKLAEMAKRERDVRDSHSVDEAEGRHRAKLRGPTSHRAF
jgi:low affinity Fe/Cu permease